MSNVYDFLGTQINVGDKGIRVHASSHLKYFKKIEVKELDFTRTYGDCVGVLTGGNSKIGWTYPERIIVQGSLKVIL